MTAQQLKNSILQMAVQGKLVPQDPNDEPASVLLERIRAEKEQLIKEKKIRREKNPSVIFKGADNTPYEKIGDEVRSLADEVPFDIPDSWEWVRIRSLGEIVRGSGIKRNETVQQGLPCVRYGELYTTYQTSFTSAVSFITPDLYEKCKHFSYGDVLMTLTGENKPDIAKAVAYLGAESIAAGGDLAFWTQHGMNPLFLSYIMASPYIIGRKVALATGDIIVHISGDKLGTILLPVPPLAEQGRIVARIQEAELVIKNYALKATALQELQDTFPEALKKSILQEAVQGKLVPQDSSDEPAEVLLERIQAEKQRLIKEGKIKRDKHESIIFRRDNSHYEKRGAEAVCIDDEIPFEIPENWTWAKLSSASVSIADGDHQPPPQVQDGIPFLVISNVSDGRVDFSNTRYVSKEYFASLADIRIPQRGDLLFTVTGSYGIVIPVQTERKFCFQRHIALIKLSCLSPEFMRLWLSSPLVYEQCRKSATGTAQKTVGLASLKGLLIPIPPLNEQMRIIQKLNTLLALAAL